jgi:hypothetical protein
MILSAAQQKAPAVSAEAKVLLFGENRYKIAFANGKASLS